MRQLKALITGIAGFAGSHLAEFLLSRNDIEVIGVIRSHRTSNIEHLRSNLRLFEGDVADLDFVKSVVSETNPDFIFHLAGQADVSLSWKHPGLTFAANVNSQLNVLEAVAQCGIFPRVLVVGSGDEYGLVLPSELPVGESNPLRPNSPYAVSKIAQDMLGYQYFVSYKLNTIRVRPFNHIGPRQTEAFVVSSFAKQIAEAEFGLREPVVKVGNLDARRDFTDVRDIVRGYWLAASQGEPGEVYNLGSGRAHSISEILQLLLANSNIKMRVEQDASRLRPSDVPEIVCDYKKLRVRTDWEPRFPLQESLVETLDYWRAKVSQA